MSYDLAVWRTPSPLPSPDAARRLYDSLFGGDPERLVTEPAPAVAAFLAEVLARHPAPETLPGTPEETCPWVCEPEAGTGHVVLSLGQVRARELTPWIVATAHAHGLDVYDPQTGELWAQGGPLPPSPEPEPDPVPPWRRLTLALTVVLALLLMAGAAAVAFRAPE